jgi:hypothetical protein
MACQEWNRRGLEWLAGNGMEWEREWFARSGLVGSWNGFQKWNGRERE